jgi:hypothetical protein
MDDKDKNDGEEEREEERSKKSADYFEKLLAGKAGQDGIQTALWQDFCNTLALLSFKAIIDAGKLNTGGGETRDKVVELVISEWKKRSLGILSSQVNQYAEMKRSPLGKLMDVGLDMPDEETIKIKFMEAIRSVEKSARDMLTL